MIKVEIPVQPQVSGTKAYVCPRLPKELIGHTELAYSGPANPPLLYMCGQGPKDNYVIRKTINYSHRLPPDGLDTDTYVHVVPLPDESSDYPKFKQLLESVAKKQKDGLFSSPQCDQVERAYPNDSKLGALENGTTHHVPSPGGWFLGFNSG